MKKIEILVVAFICLIFTGCKEYGEKRIVNIITADSDKIAVYYYDFSGEEPAYLKEEKDNNGIKNTLVQILSEADYDLKLCRYAVVSGEIISDNINELYFALTDSRFAPDIIIVEGETNVAPEEYEKNDKYAYPLYNYSVNDNTITCVVEKADNNEKNIIIEGGFYKQLDEQQSFAFDILNRTKKQGTYKFEKNGEVFSAELKNINAFNYVKDNMLYITLTAVMESYKGMPAGEKDKKIFENLLEKDIYKNITELLEDKMLTDKFNLMLYDDSKDYKNINLNINII